MNRKTRKELEGLDRKILKENISIFGKKEYYEKILEIYKPLFDVVKKQKRELKAKGIYDLVTVTDKFTGEEAEVHIGVNLMDKVIRKGKRALLKKVLHGLIMGGKK